MSDPKFSNALNSGDLPREPSSAELALRQDPQVGTAYAVSVRSEGGSRESLAETVLTFRLRRLDPSGRELPPLSVEMRGRVLTGMIADGDLIRVPTPVPNGGALQLKTVANLSTNAPVSVRATLAPAWVGITATVIIVLLVLVIFGVVAVSMIGMARSPF